MDQDQTVWVLHGKNGECRGVYLSQEELSKGVSYWMKESPEETLCYAEWEANKPQEPNGWDWAYIPTKANQYQLAAGGANVPKQCYWGQNLIAVEWESIPGWGDA